VVHVDVYIPSGADLSKKKNLMDMALPEVHVTTTVAGDDISDGTDMNYDTGIISRHGGPKSDHDAQEVAEDTRGNDSNIRREMPQDATNEEELDQSILDEDLTRAVASSWGGLRQRQPIENIISSEEENLPEESPSIGDSTGLNEEEPTPGLNSGSDFLSQTEEVLENDSEETMSRPDEDDESVKENTSLEENDLMNGIIPEEKHLLEDDLTEPLLLRPSIEKDLVVNEIAPMSSSGQRPIMYTFFSSN